MKETTNAEISSYLDILLNIDFNGKLLTTLYRIAKFIIIPKAIYNVERKAIRTPDKSEGRIRCHGGAFILY
jgi:hypothetical protein